MQHLDDRALGYFQNCPPGPNSDYRRSVTVTPNSPTYVTLLVSEDGYCPGTAHPWVTTYPPTYDRVTDAQVAPIDWLPPTLAPDPAYLNHLHPATSPLMDCPQILQTEPHHFDLWPDAAAQSLMMLPVGLAYVFTPCVNPVAIDLATLRHLNVSPRLLDALTSP